MTLLTPTLKSSWVPLVLAKEYPIFSSLLLLLGSLTVAQVAFKTLYIFAQTFLLSGASLKKFGAKKGAWAVVTGASDGIGQEFALQLAKAGFNILLVARNKTALEGTAALIAEKTGSSVQTLISLIDFSKKDEAAYEQFAKTCEGLDIGVLVNNVGKSHEMPVYFWDTPQQEIDDILTININATLRVTSIVLPQLISKKRGLVLNIGSFAGAVPSPMLATYSGSKAFLATWSSALAEEVRKHNITVEHVNTYFVVSKMSKIRRSSPLVPTASSYVRSVLGKVGLPVGAAFSGRPGTSTPFWTHSLADWALNLLVSKGLMVSYTHGMHKDIRKRALKKKEREAKQQ